MKALFTYDFGKDQMKAIKSLGVEITMIKENEIGGIGEDNSFEVLVCNKGVRALSMTNFKGLRWIQLVSAGLDEVPLEILKSNNIVLTNCKGAYSIPVAEWTLAKILELYKRSRRFYQLQNNRDWHKYWDVYELNNKKACVLGTGSIGVEIAKRLKGFGVVVTGINSSGGGVGYFDQCTTLEKLDEVLGGSDMVINTLPLTKATTNLINGNFLNKMKRNSILINVSRGNILDEYALIKYLKSGHLLGAALDVFQIEPLPQNSPLWLLDNLIITPHISYASDLGNQRVYEIIYDNFKRYIGGEALINKVDCNKGY